MGTNVVEIWNSIPNHPRYEVSNIGGKIWDNEKCGFVGQFNCGEGYIYACLNLSRGQNIQIGVHRIVLWAFKGFLSTPSKQVNHKDGNKKNNNLDNLELVTPSQNVQHAYDAGLHHGKKGKKK